MPHPQFWMWDFPRGRQAGCPTCHRMGRGRVLRLVGKEEKGGLRHSGKGTTHRNPKQGNASYRVDQAALGLAWALKVTRPLTMKA